MNRPRYTFRPSLHDPAHQKAWKLLCNVPPGQRNDFLAAAILCKAEQNPLEKTVRRVVREELAQVQFNAVTAPKSDAAIPAQALDFLASL